MNRTILQTVLRRVEAQAVQGRGGLGDAELLRRFAATRDDAAFTVLVRRHGPLVWAVCRNLLPNEADAEDAFQATFLALIESASRVRTAAVGAWLHGVAVRVAKMTRRSAGRRRQRERKVAVLETSARVAAAAWNHLQAAVHEEVSQLPESLRIAFVLCNLQGKSQCDVAAELGWKPGTLTGRLSKARRQLLERLSKRGIAAGSVEASPRCDLPESGWAFHRQNKWNPRLAIRAWRRAKPPAPEVPPSDIVPRQLRLSRGGSQWRQEIFRA